MAKRKERIYWEGFGFPVILNGVSFKTTPQGYKIMDINMNKLREVVQAELLLKKSLLTGAELKFIRASLEMSQKEFADFIDVAGHSSVAQWEKKVNKVTGMSIHTEMILRLRVAKQKAHSLEVKVMKEIVSLKVSSFGVAGKPLEINSDDELAA